MSTVNKFSKDAFIYSLSSELQRRFNVRGGNVSILKTRAFYRIALGFEKIQDVEERDYKNAALAVADAIAKLRGNGFLIDTDILIRYPFSKSASETAVSDVVICAEKDWRMSILVDSYPHARIPTPAFFSSGSDTYEIVDIGKEWFGSEGASKTYMSALADYDNMLKEYSGKTWNDAFPDVPDRYRKMYEPVLNALIDEIRRQCSVPGASGRLIKTFFGEDDYYLISLNSGAKLAKIGNYDLHGQLGTSHEYREHLLDAKLVSVGFKERVNTIANAKIALTFNNGWVINVRIKRAGTEIKRTSLRLEADFKGSAPHVLEQIEVRW